MELSIIIPSYNEEESLPELLAWIERSLAGKVEDYEVIFVDDGSSDRTWNVIKKLSQNHQKVMGLDSIKIQENPLH